MSLAGVVGLLVSPMSLAGVVGLDNILGLCSCQCVLLARLTTLSTRAGADLGLSFVLLLLSEESSAENALTVLVVSSEGADVGLVDIVDDDRGNSNDLCGAGRHDCHQDEEEHGIFPNGSEQLLGDERCSETLRNVFI